MRSVIDCVMRARFVESKGGTKVPFYTSRKANLGLDPAGSPEAQETDRLVVKLLRALGGCLGVRRR